MIECHPLIKLFFVCIHIVRLYDFINCRRQVYYLSTI